MGSCFTPRVAEILGYYQGQNPGVLTNLARLLTHGRLGGTGKLVILPVDQGFEHGPGRSFAPNPAGYDPRYHVKLAIEAGCNAYAAPLGFIEAIAAEYAGQIPLILKLNNHDVLQDEKDPLGAVTSSVHSAIRLGCTAVGYTIYPGTAERRLQYTELSEIADEARDAGLPMVVWSLPARRRPEQGGRDRAGRDRLRRPDRGSARRPHHQGQAPLGPPRASGRGQGLRVGEGPAARRWPSASSTSSRARSMAAGSSSSRAAR